MGKLSFKHNVALVGFRGAGKSSVSEVLSEKIHLKCIHLDGYIERGLGYSIEELVSKNGWNSFRTIEEKYLNEVSNYNEILLDSGGGVIEGENEQFSERKYELLKKNFIVIYLYLEKDTLLSRLNKITQSAHRPPLSDSLEKAYDRREPWYRKIADFTVDTGGKSPLVIAEIITENLKNRFPDYCAMEK